ncbi:MAG TPA: DUF3105 domain-containing protein [Acidimicrobiales bacterium]|nr:DUF3105 domain-containing protein [Acidimicrobiales bacterium]
MASKKKRTPPRPKSGSRPPAKRPGPPGAGQAKAPSAATGASKAAPAAKPAAPKPARERTGPTRAERLAAAEALRRRKATRNRALIAGGLVAVLALLTITIVNSRRSNDRVVSALESSGSCQYDTRNDSDQGAGNNHVTGDVTYKVNPPSGGDHNPSPSPPGIFTVDNTPPDAQIVHSLEHGYVAIWYRPDLDTASVDALKAVVSKYPRDVLLVPRASLEQPVAATAWHRRLLCERPDAEALDRFVSEYRNKGPEKIPH